MVTLKEIAMKCNVSITTVSKVLNNKPKVSEETRQFILKAANDMGYKPNYLAQGLRRQKTKIIGVIVEDIGIFSSPQIIDGIMNYCESKQYRVILQNLRFYSKYGDKWFDDEKLQQEMIKPAIQELESIKVDGIIYLAGHARKINCFPDNYHIPVVMAYGYSESFGIPSVVIDDESASYQAINELIHNGHTNIRIIAGKKDNIHTVKRLEGCRKAFYENRIQLNAEMIEYGNWQKDSGYMIAKKFLEGNKTITALFCMSDLMASGVYDYCYEKKLLPGKDISIIGFDDHVISSYIKPNLNTMKLPLYSIGYQSANILLDALENNDQKIDWLSKKPLIKVPCTYISRESIVKV